MNNMTNIINYSIIVQNDDPHRMKDKLICATAYEQVRKTIQILYKTLTNTEPRAKMFSMIDCCT